MDLEPFAPTLPITVIMPLLAAAPRVFGFWMGLGVIGSNVVPLIARNGISLAICFFAYPILSSSMPESLPTALTWAFIIAKETLLGLGFGFCFGIIIWCFESVGGLIDTQTGTNNAAMMDQTSGNQLGPSALFSKQFAIALFVTTGMLAHLAVGVVESFTIWTWHHWYPNTPMILSQFWIHRTDTLWQMIIKLAAPTMLVLVILEFGLGLINRVTPQFDVFNIGMALKVIVSALILSISIVFWADTALAFFGADLQLLRALLTSTTR
jgi:type III secretion protein T